MGKQMEPPKSRKKRISQSFENKILVLDDNGYEDNADIQ